MTDYDAIELDRLSRTWPLNAQSVVMVIGAYQGATVKMLVETYHPGRVLAFEPQAPMAMNIERLALPRVEVYRYGLGDHDGTFPMGEYGNDAASFVADMQVARTHGSGDLREIGDAMDELELDHVDLGVMNIEGYEFVLLPHMIASGLIARYDNLMIQFHLGWPGGAAYDEVRETIRRTHDVLWDYGPAWVAWRRRR